MAVIRLIALSEMSNRTNETNTNVDFEASIVVSTLSLVIFAIICLAMVLYSRGDGRRVNTDTSFSLVVLFLGLLAAGLTTLTVPDYKSVYFAYRVSLVALVGIVVTIVGDRKLFVVPTNLTVLRPLGFHHPDMSFIIWVITIPLVLLEMFEAIGAVTRKPDHFVAVVKGVGLLQKLIQAGLYHFSLRHKTARRGLETSASWYLKLLAMLNFTLWLDSIMMDTEGTQYIIDLFGNGFSIVTAAINALLIDYRLFCCLLFAEHAVAVESEPEAITGPYENDPRAQAWWVADAMPRAHVTQMAGFGYVLGFLCFALQLVAALQYGNYVGAWSNVFVIAAEVLVMLLGLGLLMQPGVLSGESFGVWRERNSKTIDVMVALMGAVGFTFWLFKTTFCAVWTVRHIGEDLPNGYYLLWSTIKNAVRCVGILLQLYLFGKIGPLFGCSESVRKNKANYFILPVLMLALLSVFTSAVIDNYSGHVEMLIEEARLNRVLQAFWKAGSPVHLGFSLHVFLHFLIVNNNMRTSRIARHLSSRNLLYKCSDMRPATDLRPASALVVAAPEELLTPQLHSSVKNEAFHG